MNQPLLFDIGATGARFSPCRKYRYTLWRVWGNIDNRMVVIGLNPSTADATKDDPTIRRCINFARNWGYGCLTMLNLFAYRATDPAVMKTQPNPAGPDNDTHLLTHTENASLVVCAWGVHGTHQNRADQVVELLRNQGTYLHCLGTTKEGHPKHPLYLSKDTMPVEYRPGRMANQRRNNGKT